MVELGLNEVEFGVGAGERNGICRAERSCCGSFFVSRIPSSFGVGDFKSWRFEFRTWNESKPTQNESLLFTAPIHRNDNRQLRPLYNNDCPRIVLLWLMNALSLVARPWQFEFDSPCPLNLTIVILQLDVALALQRRVPSPFFLSPPFHSHPKQSQPSYNPMMQQCSKSEGRRRMLLDARCKRTTETREEPRTP